MFLCKLLQMKLAYEEHIVVDKFKERFRFFFLGKVQMILLIVLDTDEIRRIMLLLLLFK